MINNKQGNARLWIYLLIAVVVFLLLFSIIVKKEELGSGDVIPGGSSGGGSDTGDVSWFGFPDFSDMFDWDIPCFWNCGGTDTDDTTPIIPTSQDNFCVDSDYPDSRGDAEEIYVKGTCDDNLVDRTSYTDYCSRGSLIEYYCRSDQCASKTVDCSADYGTDWGCEDGRCVALL